MYIEWKRDNLDIRVMLLYFQELFLTKFLRPYYFSKGNITSARRIIEFCNEGQIMPMNYIRVSFLSHAKDMEEHGFKFFNSNNYKLAYLDKILKPDWYGAGTKPTPIYDKIRYAIKPIVEKDSISTVEIIDAIINDRLGLEPFLYMIKSGYLDFEAYAQIVAIMNKNMLQPMKIINLLCDRGILPETVDDMMRYKTFIKYCEQDDGTENSDTIKT
jgi:hypothetical protein